MLDDKVDTEQQTGSSIFYAARSTALITWLPSLWVNVLKMSVFITLEEVVAFASKHVEIGKLFGWKFDLPKVLKKKVNTPLVPGSIVEIRSCCDYGNDNSVLKQANN